MLEVDIDDSGTVDFYEFLCVARLISQGKGKYKVSDRKIKEYICFEKGHLTRDNVKSCYGQW